tara:strand:+ start:2379 stop:3746 length:1368 start_codon:yes stop_codon:yes gene_type:complete
MEKQTEKQKTEWFNKLRLNSWEVEILIVGFVLVMMLQIPSYFDALSEKALLSSPMQSIPGMISWAVKMAILLTMEAFVYVLIITFSVYLGLRGFWVGLIGFSSVFPNGINLDKLNYSKIFSDKIKDYNFNDYILKIDNMCSMIFSFSFFLVLSAMSMIIFLVQVLMLVLIKAFLLKNYPSFVLPFNILIHWPHLLFGFIYFMDFTSATYLKKVKWRPFSILWNAIDVFFTYTTFIFIYQPLYYAIVSNIKQRVLILCAVGIVLILSASNFFDSNEHEIYFPQIDSENLMQNLFYENKFQDIDDYHILPQDPFINADIITDNYLKLYIPYYAESNAFYKRHCENIEDISLDERDKEKEEHMINCLNNIYEISIDDKPIESDFVFYNYSKFGVQIKSFFMAINIDNIENGRHNFKISEIFNRVNIVTIKDGEEVAVGTSPTKRTPQTYIIPFYLFRD